jgi:hypothetical protein
MFLVSFCVKQILSLIVFFILRFHNANLIDNRDKNKTGCADCRRILFCSKAFSKYSNYLIVLSLLLF